MDENRIWLEWYRLLKLPNGKYTVKIKKDERLDYDCVIKNILPAHLGAFS